jgi:hypothetical protein
MNTKAFFGIAAAAVLALAGCASSSDTKPTAAVTGPMPDCSSSTASLRAATTPNCAGVGRSYSSKELNRNGATSIGDAMRQLDPAITVHQ